MKLFSAVYFIIVSFFFFGTYVEAQKLPNIQADNLWAPVNIKIDGNIAEWSNGFKAHNNATSIFYTIANDDKNLYLVIQATDPFIIRNILNWSIRCSIDLSGKKTAKGAFSVTYPYFEKNDGFSVNLKDRPKIIAGSDSSIKFADSFMNVTNARMIGKMKLIKVSNVKAADTIISIYNEEGLRAASQFDNKMNYTYELSISLKELGTTANNSDKFAYQITVNGNPNFYPGTYAKIDKVTHAVTYEESPPGLTGTLPTDFWGEYTFAKKP